MVIVEFFDKTSVENIASSLLCHPDIVIFVGDNTKRMQKTLMLYQEILEQRNISVALLYKTINHNNLQSIVDGLMEIVAEYPDCIFDLTGGEDLVLVAVGIIAERFQGIQLHRFNIRNHTMLDCDADGNTLKTLDTALSVEENVRIYGGKIVWEDEKPETTYDWEFNNTFQQDIHTMWLLCCQDTRLWNKHINTFDKINKLISHQGTLCVEYVRENARRILTENGEMYYVNDKLLHKLAEKGLIENLIINRGTISFAYKNDQVKQCLTQAGKILELYVTIMAMNGMDKTDDPVYDHVMNGVYIDWDGEIHPALTADGSEQIDVENEIDVMMVHGMVPVFVSCKNGYVEIDELYKLETVAERFGAKYSKKVLIVSDLHKMGVKGEYIRARAKDMRIRLIENAAQLTEMEFSRLLRSLWQ